MRVGSYDAVRPLHQLWLGYAAELLALPIRTAASEPVPDGPDLVSAAAGSGSSTLLSAYPARSDTGSKTREATFNVINLQTKLIKAEFVGCMLSGVSLPGL